MTWVITGGSSGMGLELARRVSSEGAEVYVFDLQPPPSSLRARFVALDLTDVIAVGQAMSEVPDPVDVLVHCAGSMFSVESDDAAAPEQLLRATALHAGALIAAVQALLPRMSTPGASVVAVSSIAQHLVYPRTLAYGPSKAALARVIAQLAVDLGPRGIRVNGIAPGAIRTPMSEPIWADPELASNRLKTIPLRRPGVPEDIVRVIRFLASPEADYVTGCVLPVDGGLRLGLVQLLGA